jgi:hypothetical protein
MKQTSTGSNDGLKVTCFTGGCEYLIGTDISMNLAKVFVDQMKVAEFVKPVLGEPPSFITEEEKKMETVPENKVETSSPENKKEDKKEEKKEEKEEDKPATSCFGTFDSKDKGCKSCDDKKPCQKATKTKR